MSLKQGSGRENRKDLDKVAVETTRFDSSL